MTNQEIYKLKKKLHTEYILRHHDEIEFDMIDDVWTDPNDKEVTDNDDDTNTSAPHVANEEDSNHTV